MERRLASVGWAVNTGRTASPSSAEVPSAPTRSVISAIVLASQPSSATVGSPRTRCTCSAAFARWK